ncbi:hypothetical protein MflW12_6020 [Mesoplasma florum]|uniref:Uncharacterized protein n=1 Tax=Mesoplasma florum TaxID=2151 RepID=A0AAD0HSE3_MESFO|nr:hypothetical protein MflW12_6020 [Mesoplasma florum]
MANIMACKMIINLNQALSFNGISKSIEATIDETIEHLIHIFLLLIFPVIQVASGFNKIANKIELPNNSNTTIIAGGVLRKVSVKMFEFSCIKIAFITHTIKVCI